ncbi:sigma-70 family RNA polymerase sigma factor [Exilibacterium tricleocarpae]|uniref:Sigma-70 family RNA polymerase sigma factor n=1 Tax=Exilibacterium tricleocarpae TaxID=2591008 RepID=A0A545U3F1_9GAMM|nr:sigma-70 family RNA polymerase sigma factor [Exilibacterium tricleocarpae]TQV84005.1 sigma-70 family RNA polymerase sigma factor [Exilibacterium tricleocarpae]
MKTKSVTFLQSMFREHNTSLLRFLTAKLADPHEAEDIAQDAYHNMLRVKQPEQLENARAYLFQTAANLALNRLRKQRRQGSCERTLHAEAGLHNTATTPSTERTVCAQYELEAVLAAVDTLPEQCRRAFMLSRAQGSSYREISVELGVSISTVEKYLIRALEHLRTHCRPGRRQ